jgi:hypothetical protein
LRQTSTRWLARFAGSVKTSKSQGGALEGLTILISFICYAYNRILAKPNSSNEAVEVQGLEENDEHNTSFSGLAHTRNPCSRLWSIRLKQNSAPSGPGEENVSEKRVVKWRALGFAISSRPPERLLPSKKMVEY